MTHSVKGSLIDCKPRTRIHMKKARQSFFSFAPGQKGEKVNHSRCARGGSGFCTKGKRNWKGLLETEERGVFRVAFREETGTYEQPISSRYGVCPFQVQKN